MNGNLSNQQFARIDEVHDWESADFETPMRDVPQVLEDRENLHGTGQDYTVDNQRTNVHGYLDHLASSIKEHGWQEPIKVHSDNVVTDGHHRYAAAVRAGLTHVPVERIDRPWFK